MAITSSIQNHGGVPTLFVNGQPLTGLAYMTYLPERADYAGMSDIGCKLFSVCLYLASRPVNAAELCGPFGPGIYENISGPDFTIADKELEHLLSICPDAFIFPRINLNLPSWWDAAHPSECNDLGVNGNPPRPCVASRVWQQTVADYLEQLISYIEASPWADHIIGYQLAGGQTEEWMSIDMNGNRGSALRQAFEKEHPLGTQNDWRAYSSIANVQAIEFFATRAKKILKNTKVIGAFYGYTFETPWWQQSHAALQELLAGNSVDFLCSPLSYNHLRAAGIDWACMTVLDTVKRHGRLYFAEADVRTCNTLPLCESKPGICSPGNYSGGLWSGPEDPWICCQQLRCVFGRMLTHGHALWWFDMWGGWYDRPEFRAEMKHFFIHAQKALADADRGSLSQLAVFIDEKSCTYIEEQNVIATTIASENRIPLGSCGVPYDVFDISDFSSVYAETDSDGSPRYSAAVFLIPASTPCMSAALELWKASGREYLVADTKLPLLDASEIHKMCQNAGIHCWTSPGDVLYANTHWIVLHAAKGGVKTIRLPDKMLLQEVCTDVVSPATICDQFEIQMKQYETRIYRIDTL